MEKYVIALDDPTRGHDRVIYITTWGTSPWKIHAEQFTDYDEANGILIAYLSDNDMEIKTGKVIELPSLTL